MAREALTCKMVSCFERTHVICANIKGPLLVTLLVTDICRPPESIAVATNQAISCYYFCNSCLNAINPTASCCLSLYFGTIIIICVHCDTN